jgi:hypothetical protein
MTRPPAIRYTRNRTRDVKELGPVGPARLGPGGHPDRATVGLGSRPQSPHYWFYEAVTKGEVDAAEQYARHHICRVRCYVTLTDRADRGNE